MHRHRRMFLGVVAGGLVVGASPVVAQVGERGGENVAAPSPGARPDAGGGVDVGTFWEILGDPTLQRLIGEALSGSHDLRAAEARVEGAEASRLHAALGLAPIVTANAGYTRRRFSSYAFPGAGVGALPDQNVWDSGLSATWELDVFGRLRGGLRARGALADAAGEDLRDTRISLAGAVARSYFDLRGAQERLAVARRNADNQGRTLALTASRLDAGRGTVFDAERARAQLSFTLAAIPSLEGEVTARQYRIAVLLGRAPDELSRELSDELLAEGALPELPDAVPLIRATEVVSARPDVQGAGRRVAASRAAAGSARADYLPRLSLVAGAGYTAHAVDAFGNGGTFNYAVGPVLSWAAFDMGRVKARVEEAEAQEIEARAYYDRALLHAQEELDAASVRYRAARGRLGHLEEAAAASDRAAALARLRYQGGVADFLQVLDAERTLLVAQDELVQARTAAADAYVTLFEARGGRWER